MRWIFVSLVLINLLYFGWSYWHQHQEVPAQQLVAPITKDSTEGQDLVLLTERLPAPTSPAPPRTIAPEKPRLEPPVQPKVVREPERRMCARLGPYIDEARGLAAVKSLTDAGIKALIAESDDQRTAQYWVLLPPAQTRRKALQTLRELQARKIDSYLITSGDLSNAISLGLFNREELAKGVKEKIREAGYSAQIQRKERLEKVFWVQISSDQAFENARKVLDELVSDSKGIKISNTPCEMFAQSN